MVDTPRTLSALQALLADNVSNDISPQDVRDFLVSVFGAQGVFRDVSVYNNAANPAYQLDIPSGEVGDIDGKGTIKVGGTLTLDITASGANGLDTGAEANSTWYYIYLIKDPTTGTVASLLSTSPTSPTMPGSYSEKRLIGAVYNDGSGNFREFRQQDRRVTYIDTLSVYSGAANTNWQALAFASLIPTNVCEFFVGWASAKTNTNTSGTVHGHPGSPAGSSGGITISFIEAEEAANEARAGNTFISSTDESGNWSWRTAGGVNGSVGIETHGFILRV